MSVVTSRELWNSIVDSLGIRNPDRVSKCIFVMESNLPVKVELEYFLPTGHANEFVRILKNYELKEK